MLPVLVFIPLPLVKTTRLQPIGLLVQVRVIQSALLQRGQLHLVAVIQLVSPIPVPLV
jgi:hypothetical protein